MANDLVNLEAFNTERTVDPDFNPSDSLASGIGTSYGIIGYRGKTWSLRYHGETHLFKPLIHKNAAGELESLNGIEVVILWAAEGKSKSYFPQGTNTDFTSGDPPLCASIDGVTPDDGVEQKQAEACGICPRNEWKTLPNGRKGRECTDYKRLAVMLMPNATKPMFGEPLAEPVFLRVPPASLNSLAMLEQRMGDTGLGRHYATYLTQITFDPTKAFPAMQFYAVKPLGAAQLENIKAMRKDPQCKRIIGEGGTHGGARAIAGPTVVNEAAFTAPSPAPKQLEATAAEEDTGLTVLSAVPTAPSATIVDIGAGAQAVVIPPQTTVADTGEPEESDAELDARIKGILGKAK